MNYDTVLPERILRRYRRRRFRVPHWIKQTLAIGAFTLTGLALVCSLALIVPGKPDPRSREIIRRALAHVGTTPPQVSASIAPRATLVKNPWPQSENLLHEND
jgi:hypothetical protein